MSLPAALHSETGGEGEPLVLLHGWGMNLRVFDPLRERLEPHYAVTAVDLPGHGASPWMLDWNPARQLELLAATIPREATLIGWSLGGQLALELAAERACAVRRLVLIASTPRFIRAPDWDYGLDPALVQQFACALQSDSRQTVADFLQLQVRGSAGAAGVLQHLRQALELHGSAQRAALSADLALLSHNDLRARARELEIPSLVLCGERDRVTPPGASEALAALLPRARLARVRRAGHVPFLSHCEQVATVLLQFLRDAPRGSAP